MAFVIFILVVMSIKTYLEITGPPKPPSRFHQALWAQSVRERGLSTEKADEEAYIMGWTSHRPAHLQARLDRSPVSHLFKES